jgi:hypothetical protein
MIMKIIGVVMMVLGFGGALIYTPMLFTFTTLEISTLKCVFLMMYLAFVLVGGVGAVLFKIPTISARPKKIVEAPLPTILLRPETKTTAKVYSPGS